MTANQTFAARIRGLAGFVALAGVFVLSACGGGSGAPNNPFAPLPPIPAALTVTPSSVTIYSQVAATLTVSGGVAPYRAFSSNSAILPVVQSLPGSTVTLLAATIASATFATITLQDANGSSAQADVLILPGPASPPPALSVLPSPVDVFSTIATQLTISGGVPPYRAFSSNTAVLPVAQNVSGSTVNLLATTVTVVTGVAVTVQDAVGQTAVVNVTVHPKSTTPTPPLVVLPSSIVTSKGIPFTLTISGGLAPYKAYSSNPAVLPVNQLVTGDSIVLVAAGVAANTSVVVTFQDSTGQTATVGVLVQPDPSAPPPTLAVLPASVVVFSGVPTSVFVTGGVPPYLAFSSNPTVLPVTQAVAGAAVPLLPTNVSADTTVTLTVQDSDNKTATSAVTVRPAPLLNSLTIKPSRPECTDLQGAPSGAICSGESGTATVTLQVPGGGAAPGLQVRFDVVAGPYAIAVNGASPTAQSLTVTSDAAGNAQVIIRTNVDAPTQPAQIRATEIASGQQLTGDFLVVQRTDGSTILTVVPPEVTFTGAFLGECSTGFRADYFIYGGTPPYRITQVFPTGSILVNSTVDASGGFFEVISNGACVNPQTFSILDATGRQVTAQLFNLEGDAARPAPTPPSDLAVVPGSLTINCSASNLVDFVISGGTPSYNASASPRSGTSPTITSQSSPPSGGFSTTPVVTRSGGIFRISNLTQSVTVSFIDQSSPQKSTTRTITCAGLAAALMVTPADDAVGTCPRTSNFVITGGAPPYTVAFNLPGTAGTITPNSGIVSGGGFQVTGLTDSGQNFLNVTDSASNQVFPSITCP